MTVGIPAIALKLMTRTPVMLWVLDLWPEVSRPRKPSVPFECCGGSSAGTVHLSALRSDPRAITGLCISCRTAARSIGENPVFPSWAEALYEAAGAQLPALENAHLPEGFRVMFAGNIGAAQDFETILAAAERLKSRTDIHWIVLGDGRMLSWVQAEVERRRLSRTVHLLGRHPLETMPAFFAQADAMLVRLRREPIFALTIPGKVQSYLASGRPIVAALDGEGARIIQEAGAGIVCPAEHPEALADSVVRLADTPKESRELMGRRGAEYYAIHFNRTVLFDQLERWMRELAGTQGGTRSSAAFEPSLSSERGKRS